MFDLKLDYSLLYNCLGFPSCSNINFKPLIMYDGFLLLIGMTLTIFVKLSIAQNPYIIPSPPSLASTSTISTSYSKLAPEETTLLYVSYLNLTCTDSSEFK